MLPDSDICDANGSIIAFDEQRYAELGAHWPPPKGTFIPLESFKRGALSGTPCEGRWLNWNSYTNKFYLIAKPFLFII